MAESPAAIPPQPPGLRPRTGRRAAGYLVLIAFAFVSLTVVGIGRHGGETSDLLRGPDDFMRMVRVDELLHGQGWTDTVVRRINPPDGVRLHWSRLSDLPLAAAILAAEPVLGEAESRRFALIAMPAFLGALFVAFFVWAGAPLARGSPLLVPMLMIGTLIVPLLQFLPGRVDHHGVQLLFAALGAGLLFRALVDQESRWPLWLGVTGGVALAVGLEALPWLGAATAALTLAWVWRGGGAARVLFAFGMAMAVTALAMIPATLPPTLWGNVTCDQLSVAQVLLVAIVPLAGAVAMAFQRFRPEAGPWARLALAAVAGGGGLAAVAALFPQCVSGPYGELSPGLRFWLDSVIEAKPLWRYADGRLGGAATFVTVPLAAFAFAAWHLATAERGEARALRAAPLLLVATGIGLVAWQIRGATYAALFAGLALVPLAAAFNHRADGLRSLLARIPLRLCVPMLGILLVFLPHAVLEPPAANAGADEDCGLGPAYAALNDPGRLGARPLTLANPIFEGPEILYYTRHRVLAAPYHRNARGIQDNRLVFAGSEAEALAAIRRRDVGAILFCRGRGPRQDFQGQPPFLSERLAEGRPPAWLAPVVVEGRLGLYRVRGAGEPAP